MLLTLVLQQQVKIKFVQEITQHHLVSPFATDIQTL